MAGSICGLLSVVLGAFGSHALRDMLTADQLRIYHTGVEYQFYHSLALLLAGILHEKFSNRFTRLSGYAFLLGIILFSGSLYLLTFASNLSAFGVVPPIGGLCFIAGWLFLALAAYINTK